jgi:hypothetical protein
MNKAFVKYVCYVGSIPVIYSFMVYVKLRSILQQLRAKW